MLTATILCLYSHVFHRLQEFTGDKSGMYYKTQRTSLREGSVTHSTVVGVIEACRQLPDWYVEEASQSKKYYQGIEFNPSMTNEEKFPYMEEWWHKAQERIVRCLVKKEYIAEAVSSSNLYLRYILVTCEHVCLWDTCERIRM